MDGHQMQFGEPGGAAFSLAVLLLQSKVKCQAKGIQKALLRAAVGGQDYSGPIPAAQIAVTDLNLGLHPQRLPYSCAATTANSGFFSSRQVSNPSSPLVRSYSSAVHSPAVRPPKSSVHAYQTLCVPQQSSSFVVVLTLDTSCVSTVAFVFVVDFFSLRPFVLTPQSVLCSSRQNQDSANRHCVFRLVNVLFSNDFFERFISSEDQLTKPDIRGVGRPEKVGRRRNNLKYSPNNGKIAFAHCQRERIERDDKTEKLAAIDGILVRQRMAFAHVEEQIHDRNVKGMPIATLREEKVRLQKRIAVLQEKACSGAAAEDTVNRLRCGIDYECYQMQPG
ncbi:hypothetical protein L915_14077 [Phytophthora nicotianae]|uniref:Uncharacterized protein n=1 Tax=Phytophthora nicotianae TaxID=4792 RepID=W2GAX9_PHYNI|nr:hypothetical protein L915_14077 [Phytophthora nicotianae]